MTDSILQTAHLWRARIDDGTLSAGEKESFGQWLEASPSHLKAFEEAQQLWSALGEIEYDGDLCRPTLMEQIKAKLAVGLGRLTTPQGFLGGGVIATALALIVLLNFFGSASPVGVEVYQTAQGEVNEITLSDGTHVTLGAKSRIDVTMSSNERAATLVSGVAFFKVARDPHRYFRVQAGPTEVEVIGTIFDLQRRGDRLYVEVDEGKVRVTHPRSNAEQISSVDLTAGQRVSSSGSKGLSPVIDGRAGTAGAWRSGQLVYVRATLADVIDDVNRYTDSPVRVSGSVQALKLSGTFDANDVEGLLSTIEAAFDIKIVEQAGSRVLVTTQ